MDDLLTAYIRQEVRNWFDHVTDREPEENEIETTISCIHGEAQELISLSICNLFS